MPMANGRGEGRRWSLEDVLKGRDFDEVYAEVEQELEKFGEWYRLMQPGMEEKTFADYLAFSDSVTERIARLRALGKLMLSEDVSSSEAERLVARVDDLDVRAEEAERPIQHWLMGKKLEGKRKLGENNATRLFSSVPAYEDHFTAVREGERHTLSQEEERILAMKETTGRNPLALLRDKIESRQKYLLKPKGVLRGRILDSEAGFDEFIVSAKPEVREAAYRARLSPYEANLELYFTIYRAVAKDWADEARLRGLTPLGLRNFQEGIRDNVVTVLLESCQENRRLFQRHFRWKAKQLGLKRMTRFDLYAPLRQAKKRTVRFEKGLEAVLEAFGEFSPDFAGHAARIVKEDHLDSHPRKGKDPNAFCHSIAPGIVPYVLLNYTGTMDSVTVLAHELGHGAHGLYSGHLPAGVHDAQTPLAETASTFGEMIVMEKLLEKAASDEERKQVLSRKLSDVYATVMRQAYFTLFEMKAHEAVSRGTTADELGDIYYDLLTEQFGDSVNVDPMFRNEWVYVPHFYENPFYCYSYAFGELLALSLYAEYKKRGKEAVPVIEGIFSSGGSRDVTGLLKGAGFDITAKEFWQAGSDLLARLQDQLESYN